jgi:branched-chain amino acid transport system ATP-binding protein
LAVNHTILELHNLYSGYGEIEVLKDVSIRVETGKIVSVLGANGAGKSTLLKTIFGIVRPTHGQVLLDGEDISRESPLPILKRGISYVPEGRSNFPYMTVEENLEMAAYIRNDPAAIRSEINRLCERFPILKLKREAEVGSLSGGQQQMVEIAMALMLQPKVILIDEPTLGLAPVLVQEVFEVIQEINSKGTTVVLVEQNAKRALEISDYAFVLELGSVRYRGSAAELARNEDVISAYLGER